MITSFPQKIKHILSEHGIEEDECVLSETHLTLQAENFENACAIRSSFLNEDIPCFLGKNERGITVKIVNVFNP